MNRRLEGARIGRATRRAGRRGPSRRPREDRIRRFATDLGDALAVECDVTDAGQVADAVRRPWAADAIIDLIRSGAERADVVPQQFGGTYQD